MPKRKTKKRTVRAVKETQPETVGVAITHQSREVYIKNQIAKIATEIGEAEMMLLMQRTPAKEIRHRPGPNGKQLAYIEHAFISQTLNWVTHLDWDLVIDKTERIDSEVIVEGHLIVRFPNGKVVTKYGTGGAIKQANNRNSTWADIYNSATSRLLKVCAARLGLGLDLYRSEDEEQATIVNTAEPTATPAKIVQDDDNEPATDNQKTILTSLKVEFPADITRGAARKLFTEAKGAKK